MAIRDLHYNKAGGKNYDYILENRCIYCGVFPEEGEIFDLDKDEDKVCKIHKKINEKGDYWQNNLRFEKNKI